MIKVDIKIKCFGKIKNNKSLPYLYIEKIKNSYFLNESPYNYIEPFATITTQFNSLAEVELFIEKMQWEIEWT